jgi:hypothetical protein
MYLPGAGFMVKGLRGFRVWNCVFRVWNLGFRGCQKPLVQVNVDVLPGVYRVIHCILIYLILFIYCQPKPLVEVNVDVLVWRRVYGLGVRNFKGLGFRLAPHGR